MVKAYDGNEPFVFISYSHADADKVKAFLTQLSGKYRFWYDEGIRSGAEWVEVIGEKIFRCDLFVVFLSSNALGSRFIGDELHYAYKFAKKMMAVYLEPVSISRSVEFMLERFQYIEAFEGMNMDGVIARLLEGLPESTKIGGQDALVDPKEREKWNKDQNQDKDTTQIGGTAEGRNTDTSFLESYANGAFADFYEEGEVLGRGGSGTVLVARSRKTGAEYAVKRQHFGIDGRDARMTRAAVRNELQKMLLLNEKPYTPVFIDYFEEENDSSLVMSRIEGMNLRDLIKYRSRLLDEQTAISIVYQMALILEDFHENGLVYGDVKPSNFLINRWGQVFIIDFGGTCSIDDRNYLKIHTPRYAAPEQITGSAAYPDFRFDVFSLGKLFAELMNNTMMPIFPGSAIGYPGAGRSLSVSCEKIYTKMTQVSPKNRYRTIGEVTAALDMLIDWSTEGTMRNFANTIETWEISKTEEQDLRDMEEETVAGGAGAPGIMFNDEEKTEAAFGYNGMRPSFFAGDDVSRTVRGW